jgi:hypothetical protein
MISNSKDKKDLTIGLIKQGYTQREIAKQAHLSNKTIGEIRKELEGGIIYKNKKQLSSSTQAFILFEENKSLVKVAIELNLPSDDILMKHSEYLKLKNRQKIDAILKENSDNPDIMEVIDLVSNKKINVNDIISKVNLKNNFDNLKLDYDDMELKFFCENESAKYWQSEFYRINNELKKLKKYHT